MKFKYILFILLSITFLSSCSPDDNNTLAQGTWELQRIIVLGTIQTITDSGQEFNSTIGGRGEEIDFRWIIDDPAISFQGRFTLVGEIELGGTVNDFSDEIEQSFTGSYVIDEDKLVVTNNGIDAEYDIDLLSENQFNVTIVVKDTSAVDGGTQISDVDFLYLFER